MFVPISSTWQLMRERQILKNDEQPAADKSSQAKEDPKRIPANATEQIQEDLDTTG